MREGKFKRIVKSKMFLKIASGILICGIIAIYVATSSLRQYSSAKSMMNKQNYEGAITSFSALGDYKNSYTLLKESRYLLGEQFLENKDYIQAKAVFEELKSYENSEMNLLETNYQIGIQQFDDQDYEGAIETFNLTEGYKETEQWINESKYNHGKILMSEQNYEGARVVFESLGKFEDSTELVMNAKYNAGVKQFNEGNFDSSKLSFRSLEKEYKDSQVYLDKIAKHFSDVALIRPFIGTWEDENGWHQLIFTDNKVSSVFYPDSHDTQVYTFDLKVENNRVVSSGTSYFIENNKLYEVHEYNNDPTSYSKTASSTSVPEEKPSPTIGMTASEVRASNWGSPIDINTTTTEYVVLEQWVYNDYKYIYLEDGIVTSISE
ncbi:tetratricopeptide repeat protein [Saccharibacillus kuerlensis]|uniref:Tetratricopeptide repeat protein n=1 Tax=Saccharibacillus kuerlensis TaxID=459527 RepID=A0ABQ2L1X2_9BACL|nr:hypothetical protein [Saccharibacillus kuerlensis]GGN99786.1 hypothetical protein GCM10010969_20230 [Saccharibacillus kuerlensis]